MTWLKGKHTFTFGGTYRQSRLASRAAASRRPSRWASPPAIRCRRSSTRRRCPGLRAADQANVQALYALLTGRISQIAGVRNIDEDTQAVRLNQVVRREAQHGSAASTSRTRSACEAELHAELRLALGVDRRGLQHQRHLHEPDVRRPVRPVDRAVPARRRSTACRIRRSCCSPQPYKADLVQLRAERRRRRGRPSRRTGLPRTAARHAASCAATSAMNYYDEGRIDFSDRGGRQSRA